MNRTSFQLSSSSPPQPGMPVKRMPFLTMKKSSPSALPHIRRGRIHIPADFCFSTAAIGMADGAMIGEVVAAFGDSERGRGKRILHLFGGGGGRQPARAAGEELLECAGLLPRAEPSGLESPGKPGSNTGQANKQNRDGFRHDTPRDPHFPRKIVVQRKKPTRFSDELRDEGLKVGMARAPLETTPG